MITKQKVFSILLVQLVLTIIFTHQTLAETGFKLPFPAGKSAICRRDHQGHGYWGWDFAGHDMNKGGIIVASRKGTVTEVIDHHSEMCNLCPNNHIQITHPDGLVSQYVHIKKESSMVSEGQVVSQGQPIARVGNVGWATGYHLHFDVLSPDRSHHVEISFDDLDGRKPIQGNHIYTSGNFLSRNDNFTTASWQGKQDALNAGYLRLRTEGYVVNTQIEGTVPLYTYWHPTLQDNFATATRQGQLDAEAAGYTLIRIEGYVYPVQAPGTIPLVTYWHPTRFDNFTTASLQGHFDAQRANYQQIRIEGYIHRTQVPLTIPLVSYWK